MLTEDEPLKSSVVIVSATLRLSIDDQRIHISNIHRSRIQSGTSTIPNFRIYMYPRIRGGKPPGVVDLVTVEIYSYGSNCRTPKRTARRFSFGRAFYCARNYLLGPVKLTPDDMHMQASALGVDIKSARSVPLDHAAASSEHTNLHLLSPLLYKAGVRIRDSSL
jgi:hypothetical protein